MRIALATLTLCIGLALTGCASTAPDRSTSRPTPAPAVAPEYYGTLEPFASEAVYFVVTDRFVNGDPGNDQREQGGERRSFDIRLPECDGVQANIGYLGGDFRGLLNNASYIRDMGFTSVWITPIVENPDQAFSGGDQINCTSFLSDRGKAAYHGYWGMNFYRVDEHLPSAGLDFADLTRELRAKGLKTVLDIVANHSSPSWSMPKPQPGFGQVFNADGALIADHQNLHPTKLDPTGNPLHAFYNAAPDLAQLGDLNADNPAVMEYLVGAYLQWIEQGAAAFRVDTIRHLPLPFWKEFAARIRQQHPGFYMFGEAFDFEAAKIAPFTWPENGAISVLDFPLKQALDEVFGPKGADFDRLAGALHLRNGPYQNPYDLTTFYDNHDMPRMNASDEGFIDAHNWLFTARGIPVIYYGSEVGFMRGRAEHAGNRNYFGQERIAQATTHPIHAALTRIAKVRAASPALQRGLQVNLELKGDRAAFYRVFQHHGVHQVALVLLNKGDASQRFSISDTLQAGTWRSAMDGKAIDVAAGDTLDAVVPAHGVQVFLLDAAVTEPGLLASLDAAMAGARRAR